MTAKPAEPDRAPAASEKADIIRAAIEGVIEPLKRAITPMVRAAAKGLRRDEVAQRAAEVLQEAVHRALDRPGSYRPGLPVLNWLVGIARNVIRGEARDEMMRPRRAEIDDAALDRLLVALDPREGATSARLDVERMLAQLAPAERKAIECRFLQGLDGRELAAALGAANSGAARVRVARAVSHLRKKFAPEVAR